MKQDPCSLQAMEGSPSSQRVMPKTATGCQHMETGEKDAELSTAQAQAQAQGTENVLLAQQTCGKDTAGVTPPQKVLRYAGECLARLGTGANRGRIARAVAAIAILCIYCELHFWGRNLNASPPRQETEEADEAERHATRLLMAAVQVEASFWPTQLGQSGDSLAFRASSDSLAQRAGNGTAMIGDARQAQRQPSDPVQRLTVGSLDSPSSSDRHGPTSSGTQDTSSSNSITVSPASTPAHSISSNDACQGRRIFMPELETQFNEDLMTESQCWIWLDAGYAWEQDCSEGFEREVMKALNKSLSSVEKRTHEPLESLTEEAAGKVPPPPRSQAGEAPGASPESNERPAERLGSPLPAGPATGRRQLSAAQKPPSQQSPMSWPNTPHTWFKTSQFALEVIFHSRMRTYPCLTEDYTRADAVYVPFYLGLDISRPQSQAQPNSQLQSQTQSAGGKGSSETKGASPAGPAALLRWLQAQPAWQVHQGRDHFFVNGRVGWEFLRSYPEEGEEGKEGKEGEEGRVRKEGRGGKGLLTYPELRLATGVSIEQISKLRNDASVPYPTAFHPPGIAEVHRWSAFVAQHERPVLFSLVGAQRSCCHHRETLFWQCREARSCWLVDCDDKDTVCLENWAFAFQVYLRSVFCLQVRPGL